MAHPVSRPRPEFIQSPPPPSPPQANDLPKANDSSWLSLSGFLKNSWNLTKGTATWTKDTATAPVGWGASRAAKDAIDTFVEAYQNNKEEIVSNIVEMANQAMYRRAPAAFEGAQSAIQQFLNTPNREHLAALQELLAQASVDQNPSVYTAISEAGKERVTALVPVLQGLAVEKEGPLIIDAATRAHIQDVNYILPYAASRYTGVMTGITRTFDQYLNRVEHVPQKAISNVISSFRQGGAAPSTPPAGVENAPPPAPPSGRLKRGSFHSILSLIKWAHFSHSSWERLGTPFLNGQLDPLQPCWSLFSIK